MSSKPVDVFIASILRDGWAVTPPVVPPPLLASTAESLAGAVTDPLRGGARNLLDLPAATELARCDAVRAVAESVLGRGCFAVRGLLFDKRPGANWKVPWHQDLTIAVREQREVEGFGPWSVKAGVTHVQAPPAVLEQMLAVRIHLDDCGADNGPLRLISGTHTVGVLRPPAIDELVATYGAEVGVAVAGSILAFRPLLLHASSAAATPSHRRVVHLDFAACELPGGLDWRWRVGVD